MQWEIRFELSVSPKLGQFSVPVKFEQICSLQKNNINLKNNPLVK
jgi:hypothetical protein